MSDTNVEITIQKQKFEIQPGLIAGHQLLTLAQISGQQQLLLEIKDDIDVPVLAQDFLIIDGGEAFSIGDGEPPIVENPCLRVPITFFFNGEKFSGDQALKYPKITGAEIKALDPDGQSGDGLFAEIDEIADEPIRSDQRILVQKKDRFITTPCGNVGYGAQKDLLSLHLGQVTDIYPDAKLHKQAPGYLLVIPNFQLPDHWSRKSVDLLIVVPDGYPLAALDMFYVNPEIHLKDGRKPGGADNYQEFLGSRWQRFSWHYQGRQWAPTRETLVSHIQFCQTRLLKAE